MGRRTKGRDCGGRRTTQVWYTARMTKDQVKAVLDRVLTWPSKRQEDAARVLAEMEQQDTSPYQLSDEQAAEVERRLADPKPKFLPLEEVRARFMLRRA